MQGKRTIESQGPLISTNNKLGVDFKLTPNPHYLESRIKMFQQIKKKIDELYTNIEKPEITIKLKDGKEIKGQAFLSTPYSIAKSISKNLAQNSIVAKVTYTKRLEFPLSKGCVSAELQQQSAQQDGQYIDLNRPLEGDCLLELFTFEDKKGKQVFWHSSAHLLGQILELNYGAWLTHGPSLDNGFFYDSFMGSHRLSQTDYQKLENDIKKSVQQKQPYERIILTKNQALQMFADNPFKVQLIQSKVPQNSLTSAYKCGKLIDLCTGPHIPNSEKVKGFKITKNSSAYWLGNNQNDDLQRVYAISFPKQSLLQEYIKTQQELAKRDHRNIGPKQGLFNFSPLSPGSAFFFPDGAIIYNKLQSLIRQQYKLRGYQQVITPNIYNQELWKISGHYFKYKQNIYFIHQDGESHGLKPMNCPGHCLMFDMIQRSYRDLPIRFADFGVLHRNQVHGALSGLTRVRRFQQDDAHIFCMPQQIQNQIVGVLEFLDYIYSLFDFKYKLQLSTRPQKFLGQIEVWNKAQSQLKEALKKFGKDYIINEGDGAFYGPKIDVKLFDAFGRQHQCGTVQLDFQLPLRFNLQYRFKQQKVEQNKTEKVQQKLKQKKEKKQKKKKDQKEEKQQQGKQLLQSQIVEKPNQTEVINEIIPENISEQAKYDKIGELKNGFNRPVMIHRAILGSLQRMIAILCQHTGGKWPFWLSPRQLILIPIGAEGKAYAELILNRLVLLGYNVNVDNSGQTLNKKIRNAQLENYNYIGVIGNEQVQSQTIDLRDREKSEQIGKFSLEKLINLFKSLEVAKSQKMIQIQGKAAKI